MKNKLIEGEDEYVDGIISDKAAGLYGSFFSFGVIAGPFIGSAVFSALNRNWNLTCDVFAIICGVYVLLFFLFNVLPDIHKDKAEREAME